MTKVITKKVRFENIDLSHDGLYRVRVLIPRSDRGTLERIREAVGATSSEAARTVWRHDRAQAPQIPLKEYDADYMCLDAASDARPGIIDADLQILQPEQLRNGCQGFASLSFFPYDAGGGKGIGAGVNNMQITEGIA